MWCRDGCLETSRIRYVEGGETGCLTPTEPKGLRVRDRDVESL